MNDLKSAAKLALEALESCTPEDTSTSHVIYAWHDEELVNKAIKALEEALAKQENLIPSNSTELEKQEQPKVRTGNCLLTGVCATEGHKIQPKQEQGEPERCHGCEACINTACGRDECPKGWPKAVQPEQEPVAWITQGGKGWLRWHKSYDDNKDSVPLYTTPPQRKPLEPTVPEDANINQRISFKAGWKAAEAAHGIKE